MELKGATVQASPTRLARPQHLQLLLRLSESTLEKQWLNYLEQGNLNLPSHAQKHLPECQTRPDFYYEQHRLAVYIDGPIHQYPDRHQRDVQQKDCLENNGYQVLRFGADDDWANQLRCFPGIFGELK